MTHDPQPIEAAAWLAGAILFLAVIGIARVARRCWRHVRRK